MVIAKSIPVDELVDEDIPTRVEQILKSNPKKAHTIMGMMVEYFGTKEQDIDCRGFGEWKKRDHMLYNNISRKLKELVERGKVSKQKKSKAYYYWWRN